MPSGNIEITTNGYSQKSPYSLVLRCRNQVMHSIRKVNHTILPLLMLFLYINLFAGMNFFYHTHYLDGKWRVHSHPYKNKDGEGQPFASHTHSATVFFQIKAQQTALWKAPNPVLPVEKPCRLFLREILSASFCTQKQPTIHPLFLRGPPVDSKAI